MKDHEPVNKQVLDVQVSRDHELAEQFVAQLHTTDAVSWVGVFETIDALKRPHQVIYLAEREHYLDVRDIFQPLDKFLTEQIKRNQGLPVSTPYFLQGDVTQDEIPDLIEDIRERFGGDPTGEQTTLSYQEYFANPLTVDRITDVLLSAFSESLEDREKYEEATRAFIASLNTVVGPQAFAFYRFNVDSRPVLDIATLWSHPLVYPLPPEEQAEQTHLNELHDTYADQLTPVFSSFIDTVNPSAFASIDDFKEHYFSTTHGPIEPVIFFTLDELRNGSKEDIETLSFERMLMPSIKGTIVQITSSIPLEELSTTELCEICGSTMQAVTVGQTLTGNNITIKSPTPGFKCTNEDCGTVYFSNEGVIEALTKATLILQMSGDYTTANYFQASVASAKQTLALEKVKQ